MILAGLVGLGLGGKWIVDGALAMVSALGMSEAFVGLTIVAIGTSLPELATSAIAALKKQTDIAVGNVVGSNIFNIFLVLGASSTIRPLPFSLKLNSDVLVTLAATFLLFIFMFLGKKHKLQRHQGVVFVICYVLYLGFLFMRG
jgi:cation:H+ antiporter